MPAAWVAAAAAVVGTISSMDSGGGSSGAVASNQVANQAANQAAAISQDQWDYYKKNYQPLESNLIQQAQAAGSPEEYARNRGTANADVTGGFDQARKQTASRMQSYGINPGSPAFQSAMASTDLAEGATKAGALTAADARTRELAYSKGLDVVGLGKGIPAQSAASSANAANAATNASRNAFAQNQTNMQNTGYAINTVGNAAQKWYGMNQNQPNQNANYNSTGTVNSPTTYGDTYSTVDPAYGAKGGKVTPIGFARTRYAKGGIVSKNPITPHMRYASGGGVGRQGLEPNGGAVIDNETGKVTGPGTGTSDSVPAEIDGQEPAALSSGEFVMNAEVPKLSGDEILEAINQAGLKKRQQAGLNPRAANDAPSEGGDEAYAEGGRVRIYSGAGLGGASA